MNSNYYRYGICGQVRYSSVIASPKAINFNTLPLTRTVQNNNLFVLPSIHSRSVPVGLGLSQEIVRGGVFEKPTGRDVHTQKLGWRWK